ncbi:TM2 domain-containing protein 2, variant 4 [Schistosoma haematobium]|uniref:TM2 domain-containing protein 2, variant 4 n=1 Tax=Schistosoma haematobium TaxID=6185 RepID=A0A922LL21_SCHHA|nr:TM2 domain-containing protein 2, variant 4 [Schistosoma haematobium]KAH9588224.1 TM2 domain-containing protein 2, variant 4 [Schistosoma haematobium]
MSGSDFRLLDDDTQFMDKYPNGLSLVDLLPFYDSIAKNEPLKLEWVCPGKIDPNVQREIIYVVRRSLPLRESELPDTIYSIQIQTCPAIYLLVGDLLRTNILSN